MLPTHAIVPRNRNGLAPTQTHCDEPTVHVEPIARLNLDPGVGDTTHQFGAVTDAVLLSNGDLVVADGKALHLRLFDPTGRLLRTIGRMGDGPGDFQAIARVFASGDGDTVIVWDDVLNRLSWITSRGSTPRTVQVPHPPAVLARNKRGISASREMVGMLKDETWISFYNTTLIGPPMGVYSDTFFVESVDRKGMTKFIGALFRKDFFQYNDGRVLLSDDVPFTALASLAVGSKFWYYSNGSQFSVEEIDQSGTVCQATHGTPHVDAHQQ